MRKFLFSFLAACIVFIPSVFGMNTFSVESIGTSPMIEARKHTLSTLLTKQMFDVQARGLTVIIDQRQKEPRGKLQGKTMTLSAAIEKEGEFLQLFAHEFAHYIDIYSLTSTLTIPDPSEVFYRISWEDTKTKKAGEGIRSFVSGYAASNKYEDFAESYSFYVFHNDIFLDRAMKNESLRQKYLFFQKYVFVQGEFTDTDFSIGKVPEYLWDTTKLPISPNKYLYSLY